MKHRLRRYDVFRFAQNDVAPTCRNDAMFASMCRQTHIIRRSRHHWAKPTSFAARQTSLKKALAIASAFFWWGMVDSDHRSQWQQIYSLPPLAAREIPHMELVIGVEPTTCWLQISCSAIEPHQQSRTVDIITERFWFVNTFFEIFFSFFLKSHNI